MLAEGLGEPARYQEYARRVADEAERLGRVVSNVLGFSHLERRALQVRPVRGDLNAAVQASADRQRPALEAAGMRLEIRLPEGALEARFDPDAVAQILQNLLDNAEKYTRGCPDRTVTVSLAREGDTFLIAVEDRGPGVPQGMKGRLFQPFSRGESADAPAGLGLGLALSRALAREQGGDLKIEEGPGARFTLSVPT
jgi:signal transduction histidine kinase